MQTSSLKSRIWRIARWFILGFIVLFVFRLGYGYMVVDTETVSEYTSDFFSNLNDVRKNYASEKKFDKPSFQATGASIEQVASVATIEQKYEKTASIKSRSTSFSKDQQSIISKTKAFEAVIQYEQRLGLPGNRQLHLVIGVLPNKFDSFYLEMKKYGRITSAEVTKIDKTNECKQLNAKKTALEKTLQSLLELKSKSGHIKEFVDLADKILEVEGELQDLGVELGNFNSENEFCTVKLSLYEGIKERSSSLYHRVKVALEWTFQFYTMSLMIAFFVVIGSAIVIFVVDRVLLALSKK